MSHGVDPRSLKNDRRSMAISITPSWFGSFMLPLLCPLNPLCWSFRMFLLLYLISFFLPVVETNPGVLYYGIEAFLIPLAMLPGTFVLFVIWLANPFAWCSAVCIVLKYWSLSMLLSSAAIVFGLMFFFHPEPRHVFLSDCRIGYFCWLSSFFCLFFVSSWKAIGSSIR